MTPSTSATNHVLAGLTEVTNSSYPDDSRLQTEDINADLEGEQETLPDLSAADFEESVTQMVEPSVHAQLTQTVEGASKGVSDTTDKDYQR